MKYKLPLIAFLFSVSMTPPALADAENAKMISDFLNFKSPVRVGVVDWVRSKPEGGAQESGTEFLSGVFSKEKNVPVPCKKTKCQHIEFVDIPPLQSLSKNPITGLASNKLVSVMGNRWEVGTDHLVPGGGFGFLAPKGLDLEPAGRVVVQGLSGPEAVKLVAVKIDELNGTVWLQAYGRFCVKNPPPKKGWLSCTAFIIPLPMIIPVKRGDTIPIDIVLMKGMKNPLALTKQALKAKASFVKSLKSKLISQGIATAADFALSGGSTGGGGGASPTSSDNSSGFSFRPLNSSGSTSITKAASNSTSNYSKADQYDYSGYNRVFNGRTMLPVQYASISSGWGLRTHPITGKVKHHDGVDFPVPIGTAVMAVADGRIMHYGYDRGGYGKFVVIDHGSGYMSLYAHLDSFFGQVGSEVKMGAVIAVSGSTGASTGPHLHLTIVAGGDGKSIYSGYDIDPRTFLKY